MTYIRKTFKDKQGQPLVCAVCDWHPISLPFADLGLHKVNIRREKAGYAYLCTACYQDVKEHFDEIRRRGDLA